jgi:hypothetical protein
MSNLNRLLQLNVILRLKHTELPQITRFVTDPMSLAASGEKCYVRGSLLDV